MKHHLNLKGQVYNYLIKSLFLKQSCSLRRTCGKAPKVVIFSSRSEFQHNGKIKQRLRRWLPVSSFHFLYKENIFPLLQISTSPWSHQNSLNIYVLPTFLLVPLVQPVQLINSFSEVGCEISQVGGKREVG